MREIVGYGEEKGRKNYGLRQFREGGGVVVKFVYRNGEIVEKKEVRLDLFEVLPVLAASDELADVAAMMDRLRADLAREFCGSK